MKHLKSNRGGIDMVVIAVVLIGALLAGGYYIYQKQNQSGDAPQSASQQDKQVQSAPDPSSAVTADPEANDENSN